jgi:hypothetical protein
LLLLEATYLQTIVYNSKRKNKHQAKLMNRITNDYLTHHSSDNFLSLSPPQRPELGQQKHKILVFEHINKETPDKTVTARIFESTFPSGR